MSKPTDPPPLKSLWGALSEPEQPEQEEEGPLKNVRFRGRAYSIVVPAPSSEKALDLIWRIITHLAKDRSFVSHMEKFGLHLKAPPQSHLTIDLKGGTLYAVSSSTFLRSAEILALDHLASCLATGKEKFPELASILLECNLKVIRH
mgnify:CR=1 FL=1